MTQSTLKEKSNLNKLFWIPFSAFLKTKMHFVKLSTIMESSRNTSEGGWQNPNQWDRWNMDKQCKSNQRKFRETRWLWLCCVQVPVACLYDANCSEDLRDLEEAEKPHKRHVSACRMGHAKW